MTQGLSEISMARVSTKEDVVGLGKEIRAECVSWSNVC